jgi:GNAT superfamily N-acetyltransferase
MSLTWTLDVQAPEDDLKVIAEGVFSHGRAQARDGNAEPIACLVRDGLRVVAGGTGRTEYRRLFVSHLWVTEDLRRQGLARRILQAVGSGPVLPDNELQGTASLGVAICPDHAARERLSRHSASQALRTNHSDLRSFSSKRGVLNVSGASSRSRKARL